MNGGLLIKQEHAMTGEQQHSMRDSEHQVHHIIKREMPIEYEDIEQEPQVDGIAEDLTITAQDHHPHHHHHHQHNDSNMLDDA